MDWGICSSGVSVRVPVTALKARYPSTGPAGVEVKAGAVTLTGGSTGTVSCGGVSESRV